MCVCVCLYDIVTMPHTIVLLPVNLKTIDMNSGQTPAVLQESHLLFFLPLSSFHHESLFSHFFALIIL